MLLACATGIVLEFTKYSAGFAGHDGMISTPIATSADGRWAATGSSEDRAIIVWDLQGGYISQEWFTEDTELNCLAFSPDGRYIVSTGKRIAAATTTGAERQQWAAISIWDLHQGGCKVRSLEGEGDNHRGHPLLWTTRNCAWSPDGTCIAAGVPEDGVVHIWETTTFQHLHALEGSELLAFSSDGRWVVTAVLEEHSHSGPTRCPTARIWCVESGKLHRSLRGHINSVRAAAFDPGNTRVVTGSDDSTIQIWDAESGAQLFVLEEQARRWVGTVAFSGDGRMVLSHSCIWWNRDDGFGGVKVWDASNGV